MTDYAATPVQPIVEGLLTVSGASAASPMVPTFTGKGVSKVTRVTVGLFIYYVLTLDVGLPGNAGELASTGRAYPANLVPGAGSGALPGTFVPVPDPRCTITIRGSSSNAVPGATGIESTGVTYITPGPDGGMTQVQLCFLSGAGATVDPTDTFAAGVEIVIWKGGSA